MRELLELRREYDRLSRNSMITVLLMGGLIVLSCSWIIHLEDQNEMLMGKISKLKMEVLLGKSIQ